MIVIRNCNKKFGKLEVLKDISVTLERRNCVALIGPNGCGKTTLIKSILGMVIPDSGTILVNNKSIQKDFLYRNKIGYMPQIGKYPEGLTISEVIKMIKQLRNSKEKLDEELLHSFKLQTIFDKPMNTLSGGTTQTVSAVLAFLFNPDILILDEPTAGLDPLASEILKEKIMKEKEKGKLIIITSHILSELDDLITHIIFMQEGKIQFHNSMNELKNQTREEKMSKAIAKILKQNQDNKKFVLH